jgi:hypothetical protein
MIMWRRMVLRASVLVAFAAGPVVAQPTQPATRPGTMPTTAPATQPADLSTPRAALRSFARALHDGDSDELLKIVAIDNPAERKMVLAMAEMAVALRQLHRSSLAAYGPAGAARFTGDTGEQHQKNLERIEQAEILAAGDIAAVRYPGADKPEYELRKLDGKWRVPASQFSQNTDAATLDRRMNELAAQVKMVRELTAEIDAGKYPAAEAASEAWRAKIMHALGMDPPATKPATRPAH